MELTGPFGQWQICMLAIICHFVFVLAMLSRCKIVYYSPVHYCRIDEFDAAGVDYGFSKNIR